MGIRNEYNKEALLLGIHPRLGYAMKCAFVSFNNIVFIGLK